MWLSPFNFRSIFDSSWRRESGRGGQEMSRSKRTWQVRINGWKWLINQAPPEKFESLQYQSFQFFSIIKYHHKQTSLIINQFVCFFLLCFSVVRNSFDTSTRRPLSPFSIEGCWSKVMANHCYGRVAKSSGTQVWENERHIVLKQFHRSSRWWFQIFLLFSTRKLGKWSNLTNIFKMGWNHQLVIDQGILPFLMAIHIGWGSRDDAH